MPRRQRSSSRHAGVSDSRLVASQKCSWNWDRGTCNQIFVDLMKVNVRLYLIYIKICNIYCISSDPTSAASFACGAELGFSKKPVELPGDPQSVHLLFCLAGLPGQCNLR